MRFEVPQFIEVEDKIFGPLSWRQFLYLSGGVGMGVMIFFATNFIIFLFLGLPLALLGGALAFYPVNSRPFSYFLEAILNYVRGQRLYLWKQGADVVYRRDQAEHVGRQSSNNIVRNKPKKDIASIARKLELQAIQKTA